ncbi:MAG: hypothetical protein HOW73_47990 [Polyangiaceae bacterium]|nr:hypothetical protein [Polyangiaceae bacterium]
MSTEEKPTRWGACHVDADDGFRWIRESKDEAIAAARAELGPVPLLLQGFAPAKHADMFSTWRVVEDFQERVSEECGLDVEVSKEAEAALDEVLGAWAKKWVRAELCRFVGETERVEL